MPRRRRSTPGISTTAPTGAVSPPISATCATGRSGTSVAPRRCGTWRRPSIPCTASRSVVRGEWRSVSTAACSTSGATRSRRSRSTTWRPVRCSARKRSHPDLRAAGHFRRAFRLARDQPRWDNRRRTRPQRHRAPRRPLARRAESTGWPHGGGRDDASSRTTAPAWRRATRTAPSSSGTSPPASRSSQLTAHSDSVRALAFDPDDDTLYSAAEDQRLLVWDLAG